MRIIKCDLCKKEIKEKSVNIRFNFYENVEFCEHCALPVLKFLKKNKFFDKQKNKKLKL